MRRERARERCREGICPLRGNLPVSRDASPLSASPIGRFAAGRYDPAVIYDAASDGLHIIVGMLIVGLVFLAVIAIGEAVKAVSHRRKARRPSSY